MRSTSIMLLLAALLSRRAAAQTLAGATRVIDGDTIKFREQRIKSPFFWRFSNKLAA